MRVMGLKYATLISYELLPDKKLELKESVCR
jgi:hypothetical protein